MVGQLRHCRGGTKISTLLLPSSNERSRSSADRLSRLKYVIVMRDEDTGVNGVSGVKSRSTEWVPCNSDNAWIVNL